MKCLLLIFPLLVLSCSAPEKNREPVVQSLLGTTYYEPQRPPNVQARLDSNLEVARANWEADPSEENFIWYGRRLGYLSRFREAIDVFGEGIRKYPNSAKLFRHRGHRFISIRLFDSAVEDLIKAGTLIPGSPLEIEPDGVPNKINKPLSSTQFNIRYHLGLAHYLKGDFNNAELAFQECLKVSENDDLLVACVDWLYMTYRRQGKEEQAKSILGNINESMTIIENDSYYKRCRMYQGFVSPDSLLNVGSDAADKSLTYATQGYGVGNWYFYNGQKEKAIEIFKQVVGSENFGAFGFIAAEAELSRIK